MRLHVFLHVGLLGKCTATDNALKGFLSGVTVQKKNTSITQSSILVNVNEQIHLPSNVLLKVKVFGEDFVTEITLQLRTLSF